MPSDASVSHDMVDFCRSRVGTFVRAFDAGRSLGNSLFDPFPARAVVSLLGAGRRGLP